MAEALPHSEACERNKQPIAQELARWYAECSGTVLEIGSGTGQHAEYFAQQMPQLNWQMTDQEENLGHLSERVQRSGLDNLFSPQVLDVSVDQHWARLVGPFAAAYSANTAHIMSWDNVSKMLVGLAGVLPVHAPFALYGPFNESGEFTSEGNKSLDAWARETFCGGGLRDRQAVIELATACGFLPQATVDMPANNIILLFTRHEAPTY